VLLFPWMNSVVVVVIWVGKRCQAVDSLFHCPLIIVVVPLVDKDHNNLLHMEKKKRFDSFNPNITTSPVSSTISFLSRLPT